MFVAVFISAQSISVTDSSFADWDNVPILSQPGEFPFLKVDISETALNYLMMHNTPIAFNSEIYPTNLLDADRNSAAGENIW